MLARPGLAACRPWGVRGRRHPDRQQVSHVKLQAVTAESTAKLFQVVLLTTAGLAAVTAFLARWRGRFTRSMASHRSKTEPRAEAVVIRKKFNPFIPQAARYRSTDWLLRTSKEFQDHPCYGG